MQALRMMTLWMPTLRRYKLSFPSSPAVLPESGSGTCRQESLSPQAVTDGGRELIRRHVRGFPDGSIRKPLCAVKRRDLQCAGAGRSGSVRTPENRDFEKRERYGGEKRLL